jgi:phosphatidate cytidylyltransferase
MSSLAKRWITGLVLVSILLVVILFGSAAVFAVVVALFVAGGVWEYNHIVFGDAFKMEKAEGLISAVVICFVAFRGDQRLMMCWLAFAVMAAFILFIWRARATSAFDLSVVMKVVFGMMYLPFMMAHFIYLRQTPEGIVWILFVLVLAFAGDIAALYVGKYFGKRKLIPTISPGKTVEGMIGLITGSVLACLIFAHFFLPKVPLTQIAVAAFVGCIIGQLGDLCESAVKRFYGLKDSSALLPGHGGLLDRLDCLVFIAPFVYYYRWLIIE